MEKQPESDRSLYQVSSDLCNLTNEPIATKGILLIRMFTLSNLEAKTEDELDATKKELEHDFLNWTVEYEDDLPDALPILQLKINYLEKKMHFIQSTMEKIASAIETLDTKH